MTLNHKIRKIAWNEHSGESLSSRLNRHNAPSVSIAVIENSILDSITCEGFANGVERAKHTTLYQVASLSKPVFAALFCDALIKQGFSLDDFVSDLGLEATSLGIENFHFNIKISEILSHSAGLNVRGFPGYVSGNELPSIADIIKGAGTANTSRLACVHPPGRLPNVWWFWRGRADDDFNIALRV